MEELAEKQQEIERLRQDKKALEMQCLAALARARDGEVAKVSAKVETAALRREVEWLKRAKETADEAVKNLKARNKHAWAHLNSSQETMDSQSTQIQGFQQALNQLRLENQQLLASSRHPPPPFR